MNTTLGAIAESLGTGLPVLLLHFLTTLALLAAGVIGFIFLTPFRERVLIAEGNAAAGLVMGGAFVSLAIPLAATLATSNVWLDILLWGVVAVVLQLTTVALVSLFFRDFRTRIEQGNIAAASVLVGIQLAVALLNAGAMAG